MENINWLERYSNRRVPHRIESDVYLGYSGINKGAISFHNESFKKITNDYTICIGIGLNKIYLKDGLGYRGYKVTKQQKSNSYRLKYNYPLKPEQIGHYNIQQSKEDPDIFYIDLSQKIQSI